LRDPFLIDECLSPELVAIAHDHGYDATHVLYRGLGGEPDHALMPVIIVPGQALVEQQEALFEAAIVALEAAGDLVNKVMDVLSDGSVHISDLPVTPA
jgi:hypothetical protein